MNIAPYSWECPDATTTPFGVAMDRLFTQIDHTVHSLGQLPYGRRTLVASVTAVTSFALSIGSYNPDWSTISLAPLGPVQFAYTPTRSLASIVLMAEVEHTFRVEPCSATLTAQGAWSTMLQVGSTYVFPFGWASVMVGRQVENTTVVFREAYEVTSGAVPYQFALRMRGVTSTNASSTWGQSPGMATRVWLTETQPVGTAFFAAPAPPPAPLPAPTYVPIGVGVTSFHARLVGQVTSLSAAVASVDATRAWGPAPLLDVVYFSTSGYIAYQGSAFGMDGTSRWTPFSKSGATVIGSFSITTSGRAARFELATTYSVQSRNTVGVLYAQLVINPGSLVFPGNSLWVQGDRLAASTFGSPLPQRAVWGGVMSLGPGDYSVGVRFKGQTTDSGPTNSIWAWRSGDRLMLTMDEVRP